MRDAALQSHGSVWTALTPALPEGEVAGPGNSLGDGDEALRRRAEGAPTMSVGRMEARLGKDDERRSDGVGPRGARLDGWVALLAAVLAGIAGTTAAKGGNIGQAAEQATSVPAPTGPGLGPSPAARCIKWDYREHPVDVQGLGARGWPYGARQAFDGYPDDPGQPWVRNYWRAERPTPASPAALAIDYGRPVAVTRFVHLYNHFRTPCAFRSVSISCSQDGEQWAPLQEFVDLPPDYPQVLPIDHPVAARHYRIEVLDLTDRAPGIETHEIQTYYGATLGSVATTPSLLVQSEAAEMTVHLVSPDSALRRAALRVVAAEGALDGPTEVRVPSVRAGAACDVRFRMVPRRTGRAPLRLELWADGLLLDQRPVTLHVAPKLALTDVAPQEAVIAEDGQAVSVSGSVANRGSTGAENVRIEWLGGADGLGNLAPGESRAFELRAKARPGYEGGLIRAQAAGGVETCLLRPVICSAGERVRVEAAGVRATWLSENGALRMSAVPAGRDAAVGAELSLSAGGRPCPLSVVGSGDAGPPLVASPVPGAVLLMRLTTAAEGTGDMAWRCSVVPNDPAAPSDAFCDIEFRLAVDDPKVMFRPHIDWYTVEHGPNVPYATNGHNSATRMLCIRTPEGTMSLVPDTDNMTWGFTTDNAMSMALQVPLSPPDTTVWPPIWEAPQDFEIALPVLSGDWWEAYRHVVSKLFRFEQPRQWAMSITEMQMLSARYTMRHEVWSEQWQTVRSHPGFDFFYNFYGTTYTLPTLYSWYLATDDATAHALALKVLDWLLAAQEREGPLAGAWFSQYSVEGDPPGLVGRDQAGNRWVVPHSTATAVKTLLWYWEASDRRDARVLASAKQGADWLVATQREDGGWPYALDTDGRALTDLADAGQVWCTWALWKMGEVTGDPHYQEAALRSKAFFERTFVDQHRYMGYWEDVSGAAGKVNRSWEAYEPAVAVLAFLDMGDAAAALRVAKDAATWSWTRVTSTRQYETSYGQTTEQSLCGPSQAQSPMVGIAFERMFEQTGDRLWSDLAGAMKAINFCADPDQAHGMVATGGWDDPLTGVIGPPYDNVRPFVTPNNSLGDEYGRQVWNEWCTNQFAWLALEWLVREANLRAPRYVRVDPVTLRGSVCSQPGRVKMPEERCEVTGIEHIDVNWVGYQNDEQYVLLIMNHKEPLTVAVRPREAHLGVYTKPPQLLVSDGGEYRAETVERRGTQYEVRIPERGTALLVWERMR